MEGIKIPKTLNILPVKGGVIFPNMTIPLVIKEKNIQELIDDALKKEKMVLTITQRDESIENPKFKDLYTVGTVSLILKMMRVPDGTMRLIIQGIKRARIKKELKEEPFLVAEIEELEDIIKTKNEKEIEALKTNVLNLLKEIVQNIPYIPEDFLLIALNIPEAGKLADFVAGYMQFPVEEKQKVLETLDVIERLRSVLRLLAQEKELISLSQKIREEISEKIDKEQREYYLRQQLKAIQKELGEIDEKTKEVEELRRKIEEAKMPKEVHEIALKELSKLERIPPGMPEYTVVRNYLDWLIELPWSIETEDNLDLKRARKILDEDHFNLERVKERILEFLAVRILKKGEIKGPILCFVGPPGVGKTSLGKSIARALGRKFIRMSLGGIRDEAEIRGHRRTYVGALPGRIIQGIRQAKSKNPVFMLDEIDKIGIDFRGDPSSALLEVLDPEQNYSFSDHYLEVPFDLSKVFFIATANTTYTIPPPLLDRMEIIEIPGYIEYEKIEIAKKYLIPRQIEANGLLGYEIIFEEEAIKKIIREYTREAGLRNVERKIGTILRKIAVEIAEGKKVDKVIIKEEDIEKYLGPRVFFSETKAREGIPGIATGMAWTPTGGEILFIESTKMPGGRNLILTGQLGEVMKESAQAALSIIRSKSEQLGIEKDFWNKYDIHIHVPEGAVPKDGPSAGITIFISLVSLLKNQPVNPEIAMTGEITLRGKVMPVGGIKEKVLAAKRAGIKEIILPKLNEKDLVEIPDYVKKDLKFYFVENVDDVLKIVFKDEKKLKKRGTKKGNKGGKND
ncbi:MAG: endopeptidase La [candidate division WOR-3 bacterium]